jgi:CheY-like chemotaxis protein
MMRILVVEDDPDIGQLVQYNLHADGFEVTLATDGRPALRELEKGGVDLLVLDLMLPEMSGLEVCKAVRSDAALRQIPILIMTARGGREHSHSRVRDGRQRLPRKTVPPTGVGSACPESIAADGSARGDRSAQAKRPRRRAPLPTASETTTGWS